MDVAHELCDHLIMGHPVASVTDREIRLGDSLSSVPSLERNRAGKSSWSTINPFGTGLDDYAVHEIADVGHQPAVVLELTKGHLTVCSETATM